MMKALISTRRVWLVPAILLAVVAVSCTSSPKSALPSGIAKTRLAPAEGCDALRSPQAATMVIFQTSSRRGLVCNAERAETRLVPASTFKIPHTLIALETGAVSGVDAAFAWDGRDRGVAAWNRDLTLADAVAASAVWVFQDIAGRIGHAGESDWVGRLGYGNETVGQPSDLRHFWLAGPTRISAIEQVDFLIRLRGRDLPFSESAISQTIAALLIGETPEGYNVFGKTGAMLPIDDEGFLRRGAEDLLPAGTERTGWFVGWIDRPEAEGGPVFFAHNLDLALPGAMAARTADAYSVLRRNGFPTPE